MNLDGSAVLHGSPDDVWRVLTDPDVLARTIPGCGTLQRVGDDEYRMDVTVGVGAIRGTYAGQVRLTDQQPPSSYVMHASGAGAPGNLRAKVAIELVPSDAGTTTLTYSADAVVGGPVAGVGQRMITGVAKRMAGQFFTAIDAELTGSAVPRPTSAAVSSTDTVPVETPAAASAAPQVSTGTTTAVPSSDLRTLAVGAVGGAGLTLLGVVVGYLLASRRR
ncbi:carbon monoxide dehydrogenase subunit G [Geodermatophilus bullaregiensis]|uniref:SRPBCC family protein n=1 Tax=Geodermatophilus bullaregiensis TaxID=1564160 RepID=UPI0019588C29|nr:carbon monoxide dehydrogenase subunit G [Geodermatophilus bullaregiensis]MBM7806774.1 carbon monoxide dehydrogenase subunit G [Geodermatophilus bullaregiensis]